MPHKDLRFAERPDGLLNLGSSTIPTRCSTEEWGNKKPPTNRSSDWHERNCDNIGGSGRNTTHEEVHAASNIKPAFDIDIPSDSPLEKNGYDLVADMMLNKVLLPLNNKTGLCLGLADLSIATDHRRLSNGKYNSSYHIMIHALSIRADHMYAMYDYLNLPPIVDRAPFNISPTGRRLWRVVGASKKGSLTYFKPTFLTSYDYQHAFHDYLLTYLTGNEVSITELFPCADARPSRRPRIDVAEVAYPLRVQRRTLVRAPFLEGVCNGSLQRMSTAELERMHIDCDFGNSRVEGNRMYYECGPQGRKCMHGRHHDHNRFYVEFQRSGEMTMHCYSASCKVPLPLGYWVSNVVELLNADVWGPTRTINSYLIGTLYELALDATNQGKTREAKTKQMANMPWWRQLERTVSAYFSQFFAYVVTESLYIMMTLDTDGSMESFLAFPRGKVADTVRPYKWGFTIWEESSYKVEHATYANFVGEPFEEDVNRGEFNLCQKAMPYLLLPQEAPVPEEISPDTTPAGPHQGQPVC